MTGFLTFAVVSATAVSNVIANIDNNNNNNDINDNNDNVNNNNQISDSADATNMGNARLLSFTNSSERFCDQHKSTDVIRILFHISNNRSLSSPNITLFSF